MTNNIEDLFKRGMRRLTGAVNLVTTAKDGRKHGLTATAVCSLTVEPPTLIACVNKSASAHDVIVANGIFCVNVLAGGQQFLAELFADNSAIEQRFSQGEWGELATGAPVLKEALCSFDCRVADLVDRSTHTLFIGDVVGVLEADAASPLLYFNGGYQTI